MTVTPSGNRWEPSDAAPLHPEVPKAGPASPSRPVEETTPATPEYGWAPAPPAAASARTGRGGRTPLLAGGALAVLLAAGAGGYAIGSATAGSDSPDVTTRQGPDGFAPGQGLPGRDDDHDQRGAPEGSDGGAE